MRYLIKTGLLLVVLASAITGNAQTDPHYSQYYAYPVWLNPALTGAIDGNYRVTAMYRSQWGGISNAFATPGISADVVTNKNVSLGLNIMNQRAGTIGYSYLTGYATMAYNGVRFGYHQISMGMAASIHRSSPQEAFGQPKWVLNLLVLLRVKHSAKHRQLLSMPVLELYILTAPLVKKPTSLAVFQHTI
jgi:hypothetical protein